MNLVTLEKEKIIYPDNPLPLIDELKCSVVSLLKERDMKIATAESCTGGMLAETLTSVSGASNVFECGIVTYSNRIKTKMLGVPEELINEYGVVSAEVAKEMALQVATKADANVGIGITGVAGPGPDGDIPEGTIYIGLFFDETEYVLKLESNTENRREYNRQLAVLNALNIAELILNKGGAL